MKRIKVLVFTILVALYGGQAFAQQDAQFSQYMFNSLYYNPGFAGTEPLTRFTFIHRTQWLGYQPTQNYSGGAPQTQILSVSSQLPFLNKQSGGGFYLLHDQLGALRNMEFQLSGAYHHKIGSGTLGLGLKAGLYVQSINPDFIVNDKDDPIYQQFQNGQNNGQAKPDLGLGVWYTTKRYYGGISFDHIPKSKYSFGLTNVSSKLNNHMYITGGYNIPVGQVAVVTPSALIQTDLNHLSYNFGAIGTYNEKIWAGLHFRQSFANREISKGGKTLSNDDIILYVGVNLLKSQAGTNAMRIGYSFDFVTSNANAKKRTSHEIMLSYVIPSLVPPPKPKVRTPRYRHEE